MYLWANINQSTFFLVSSLQFNCAWASGCVTVLYRSQVVIAYIHACMASSADHFLHFVHVRKQFEIPRSAINFRTCGSQISNEYIEAPGNTRRDHENPNSNKNILQLTQHRFNATSSDVVSKIVRKEKGGYIYVYVFGFYRCNYMIVPIHFEFSPNVIS